jgi:hypothetical protein
VGSLNVSGVSVRPKSAPDIRGNTFPDGFPWGRGIKITES